MQGTRKAIQIALMLGLPLAANCTEIRPSDDSYEITRVRWGGSLLEEARLTAPLKLLTIAPFVVEAEPTTVTEMTIKPYTPDLSHKDFRVRVSSRVVPEGDKVSLTDARVVVSGGRGAWRAPCGQLM